MIALKSMIPLQSALCSAIARFCTELRQLIPRRDTVIDPGAGLASLSPAFLLAVVGEATGSRSSR